MLSWPAPTLVGKESSRDYISEVEVFRLRETREQEPLLDPDDYEAAADLIGYLDRATMEALVKTLGGLQYTDAFLDMLEMADAGSPGMHRFEHPPGDLPLASLFDRHEY